MDLVKFEQVAASFATFHQEFAPLFGRTEARERSKQYLRGLLVQQPTAAMPRIWPRASTAQQRAACSAS